MSGLANNARAIPNRCFCPPDNDKPFSPTSVFSPSTNPSISFFISESSNTLSKLSSKFSR